MELTTELLRFKKHLNKLKYIDCSNNIRFGVSKQRPDDAINCKYIALNKQYKSYMTFDIDRKDSVFDWYDLDCPQPTIITRNPASDHCQYLYEIDTPIICTPKASKKPQQYFDAIWHGLNDKLQGDKGFTGYIVRNPLLGTPPVTLDKKYQLGLLQDYIDIDYKKKLQINELGRNCTLFDSLRLEAYKLSKKNLSREQLFTELMYIAKVLNSNFEIPLNYNEVQSTCKSISRWVDIHYIGNGIRSGVMKLPTEMPIKEKQSLSGKFSAKLKSESFELKIYETKNKIILANPYKLNKAMLCKSTGFDKDTVSKHWNYEWRKLYVLRNKTIWDNFLKI
jgi:Replicase family/Primase C terminal 1 (PriCT-1)